MRDIPSSTTNSRASGDYRSTSNQPSPFVFMSEITRDCDVTARAVRKWQANDRFPTPDGNLHGRCFWRRDTYSTWQAKVLAGAFAKSSNLNNDSTECHSSNSNKNKVRK
jgi:hypothetical protein